jgi:[protein-PII] uridylyltransferase
VARRRQEALAYDARVALSAASPDAADWARSMEDAYFIAFSASEHAAHAELADHARGEGGAAAQGEIRPARNATEIVVAAQDRQALFADLALAISRAGGNVVGARIFTSAAGEALDVFFVQNAAGSPFGHDSPRALTRLIESLARAGRGETPSAEPARSILAARASPFTIAPMVTIDNDASHDATVIEASGRDRPGLLEALARALSESDLSIQSAHIDGHGERAVDTFYVVDRQGAKLSETARINRLRARITEVLDADPLDGPSHLTRAPASQAR